MTNEEVLKIIEDLFSKIQNVPQHPLGEIAVAFDPFITQNIIYRLNHMKYYGKTILLVPESLRSIWEKMEEKEGVRAERVGSRLELKPMPLPVITLENDPILQPKINYLCAGRIKK